MNEIGSLSQKAIEYLKTKQRQVSSVHKTLCSTSTTCFIKVDKWVETLIQTRTDAERIDREAIWIFFQLLFSYSIEVTFLFERFTWQECVGVNGKSWAVQNKALRPSKVLPFFDKCLEDSIPIGCVPPACQLYTFRWTPLVPVRVEVIKWTSLNKSPVMTTNCQRGRVFRSYVGGEGWVSRSNVWGAPYHVTYPITWTPYPHPVADTCLWKHCLPQTSFVGGKYSFVWRVWAFRYNQPNCDFISGPCVCMADLKNNFNRTSEKVNSKP